MSSFTCLYLVGDHCRRLDTICDPGIKGCILRGKVIFAENSDKDPSPEEIARTRRRVEKRSAPTNQPHPEDNSQGGTGN